MLGGGPGFGSTHRMAASDGLTPLRIRGKRRGASAEKWNAGRRRKPELQRRRDLSQASAEFTSGSMRRLLKSRVAQAESLLEKLPAEVLQEIFEYSGNIDLPVVSSQLAAKLSKSHHLQHELATRLLEPVLGLPDAHKPSVQELRGATRLLNSRFMTWRFFTAWLRRHAKVAFMMSATEEPDWRAIWATLRPSRVLPPPKKLLLPPFSSEKVSFLSVLLQDVNHISTFDSSYSEIAYEGLVAAIQAGNVDVVALLLGIGLDIDTELLRVAVADAGCKKDIVQMLVDASTSTQHGAGRSKSALDLLDPAIWSWAEHARKQGDDRGPWLISYLQALQRKNVPEH